MNNLTYLGRTNANNKALQKKIEEENMKRFKEERNKNLKGWNNLQAVEDKIIELETDRGKITNKRKKAQYDYLISKYQVQCKALLQEQAEEQMKNESGNNKKINDEMIVIEIDQEGEEQENENKTETNNNSKRKAEAQDTTTKEDDKNNDVNKIQRINSPTKDKKEKEVDKTQAETTNEMNKKIKGKQEQQTKKPSYKDVIVSNSEESKKNEESENQDRRKNRGEIRIRFQFQVDRNERRNDNELIKSIIYDMMQCSKVIDPNAGLISWKKDGQEKRLNGDEIKLIDSENLYKFIDIIEKTDTMIKGKTYYRNGMRIATNMSVYEFTERWGNMRYNKDSNAFKNWKPIKPAEAQNFDTAYAIGYFAGSVERGEYKTVIKDIGELTKVKCEASYQIINQRGVSNQIWYQATEEAEKDYPNPHSKEHKKIKFAHAPSALVVYVNKTEDIVKARRNIIEKYGNPNDEHWPTLVDGSRMRFVPIFKGFVKSKEVFEHLKIMLWTQAKSKAHDVLLDINLTDILEKKTYLDNQSIEQIIHKKTSTKLQDAPIIKHIIKKWSKTPDKVEYQAAIHPYMLEEAQTLLTTIKNDLVKQYGQEVLTHFTDKYYRSYQRTNGKHITRHIQEDNDYDELFENYFSQSTTMDPYTKILVDGLEIMKEEEENIKRQKREKNNNNDTSTKNDISEKSNISDKSEEGSMGKPTKEKNKENEEMPNDEEERSNESSKSMDIMSGISLGITTTGKTVEWDNLTLATEIDGCKPATSKEIEKIERTILKYNITTTETETWKNENYMEYDQLLEEAKGREYQIMKRLVKEILKGRVDKSQRDKEEAKLLEMVNAQKAEIVEEVLIRDSPKLLDENSTKISDGGKKNNITRRMTRSGLKKVSFNQ